MKKESYIRSYKQQNRRFYSFTIIFLQQLKNTFHGFTAAIFHISTARANQAREYIYTWSRCNSKRLRMCCKTLFSLSLLPFVESDMDLGAQVKVILHIENGHVLLFLGRLPVQEKNDLKLVQFFVLDVLLYRDFFDILQ